jgi:membrane associated rhomboid family serine protease
LSNPFQAVRNKYKLYKRGILKYSGTTWTNKKHKYNTLTLIAIFGGCSGLSYYFLTILKEKSELKKKWRSTNLIFNYLLASDNNLRMGKLWTLASTSLLHTNWNHLIGSMTILAFFAGPLLAKIGSARFLLLFFGAGAIGSASCIGWSHYALPWLYEEPQNAKTARVKKLPVTVGASGE